MATLCFVQKWCVSGEKKSESFVAQDIRGSDGLSFRRSGITRDESSVLRPAWSTGP